MIQIDSKKIIFKKKEVWFSDYPFDIGDCHSVIFRDCKNKADKNGFRSEVFTTIVIDLNQSLDDILSRMDKKSCKYPINKAIRDGVVVVKDRNYEEFCIINKSLMKVKQAAMTQKSVEFMKKHGKLFTAEFHGKVLGGQFYLEDSSTIRWLIGATRRLEVTKEEATIIGNANRLMIWEAIKYAKMKGLKEFDLGGYYTGQVKDEQKEKINVFKRSFGGQLTTHYIYEKDYSFLYSLFKNMNRTFKIYY